MIYTIPFFINIKEMHFAPTFPLGIREKWESDEATTKLKLLDVFNVIFFLEGGVPAEVQPTFQPQHAS